MPIRPFFFMSAYQMASFPSSFLMLNLQRRSVRRCPRGRTRGAGDALVACLHELDEALSRRDRVPSARRSGLLVLLIHRPSRQRPRPLVVERSQLGGTYLEQDGDQGDDFGSLEAFFRDPGVGERGLTNGAKQTTSANAPSSTLCARFVAESTSCETGRKVTVILLLGLPRAPDPPSSLGPVALPVPRKWICCCYYAPRSPAWPPPGRQSCPTRARAWSLTWWSSEPVSWSSASRRSRRASVQRTRGTLWAAWAGFWDAVLVVVCEGRSCSSRRAPVRGQGQAPEDGRRQLGARVAPRNRNCRSGACAEPQASRCLAGRAF